MTWSPPTKPDPGIATADQVVAQAEEMGGAAYRILPSGRVPQADTQIPYWAGFTKTTHQYGQDFDGPVDGILGAAPPAEGPVGERRPRHMADDTPTPPHPVSRHNVLNHATHQETTGEDPAPLFTQSQATGRA